MPRLPPKKRRPARVGLLGGSFNPAHDGHRHISLIALRTLALDELWWLVSPQNPLKPIAGMAPLEQRLASARALARHPRIRVTDIERTLETTYTAKTLKKLTRKHRNIRFVWLMGADNLAQIPFWERWTDIFRTVPVAVFGRSTYSQRALAGKAARRYAKYRVRPSRARRLANRKPPAWAFIPCRLHPASATAIRSGRAVGDHYSGADHTRPKS